MIAGRPSPDSWYAAVVAERNAEHKADSIPVPDFATGETTFIPARHGAGCSCAWCPPALDGAPVLPVVAASGPVAEILSVLSEPLGLFEWQLPPEARVRAGMCRNCGLKRGESGVGLHCGYCHALSQLQARNHHAIQPPPTRRHVTRSRVLLALAFVVWTAMVVLLLTIGGYGW